MLHGRNLNCRRLLFLSPLTRSKYVPLIMSTCDLYTQLHARFIGFFYSCKHSINDVVQYATLLSENSYSNVGMNLKRCLSMLPYDLNHSMCYSTNVIVKHLFRLFERTVCEDDLITVSAIEDLLSMMHDDNPFFSMPECLALLEHLCVN